MKSIALALLALLMAAAFGAFMCELFVPEQVVAQAAPPVSPLNDRAPDEPQKAPQTVYVGVWIIDIGKVDLAGGTFPVDFYLTLYTDEPMGPQSPEFTNASLTSIEQYVDTPTLKEYRVRATVFNDLSLSRYPFDRQLLIIELEDREATMETQHYVSNEASSGVDTSVAVPGWILDGWQTYGMEAYYPEASGWETYDRYYFGIQVHRPVGSAIIKTILPALIIVGAGLLTLLLPPDKGPMRLPMATGAFTIAVLFHLNMTASLPPLGYLTMADRFMAVNYVVLILTIATILITYYYADSGRSATANRLNKVARIVLPILWAALLLINFFV